MMMNLFNPFFFNTKYPVTIQIHTQHKFNEKSSIINIHYRIKEPTDLGTRWTKKYYF